MENLSFCLLPSAFCSLLTAHCFPPPASVFPRLGAVAFCLFRVETAFLKVLLRLDSLRCRRIQNLLYSYETGAHQARSLMRTLLKLVYGHVVRLAELPHGEDSAKNNKTNYS